MVTVGASVVTFLSRSSNAPHALGGVRRFFMPSQPTTPSPLPPYRALLAQREFCGLYLSFTLTTAAATMSGFALGTLVHTATSSPLLTALAMYGPTFAMVLGALTLMPFADGARPRWTLIVLQVLSLLGVGAQAFPTLPLLARLGILLGLGLVQSLNTGVRMGFLSAIVPDGQYALARSLMNITSGGMQILGYAVGATLLGFIAPSGVFTFSAALTAMALLIVTMRERSLRIARRPGLSATWRTNRLLFSRNAVRVLGHAPSTREAARSHTHPDSWPSPGRGIRWPHRLARNRSRHGRQRCSTRLAGSRHRNPCRRITPHHPRHAPRGRAQPTINPVRGATTTCAARPPSP